MKKKKYETPQTRYLEVELEQGFMKASVVDKDGNNSEVTTTDQEISGDFDFTDNTWN